MQYTWKLQFIPVGDLNSPMTNSYHMQNPHLNIVLSLCFSPDNIHAIILCKSLATSNNLPAQSI